MRCALEQVIDIVTEARGCGDNKILPASIHDGIKDFKVAAEISLGGGFRVSCTACGGRQVQQLALGGAGRGWQETRIKYPKDLF